MLNSGKKIRALRNKTINILTLVVSEKNFLNETKNHTPHDLIHKIKMRKTDAKIIMSSLLPRFWLILNLQKENLIKQIPS
jgi:hypothetical protein